MTPTGTAVARAVRTVRVRTEVAALAKTLDYSVPPTWAHDVRVGTRVRVPLHGRTVRGWVVDGALDGAPRGVDVLPLKSWLGWGPPPALVELAGWAAWRWAGSASFFLRTASPDAIVRALPGPPVPGVSPRATSPGNGEGPRRFWDDAVDRAAPTMVRLAPTVDQLDLVLSVATDERIRRRGGSVVVLVPSTGWAERLVARLVRRGVPATAAWDEARAGWPVVVGSRAGAWAPVPQLAAAVVLDAHDAAYREESTPTYSAVEVLMERARRAGVPCVLVSPVPPVALAAHDDLVTLAPSPPDERAGWPALERVDRRGADPRTGMFSEEFVRLARSVLDADGVGEERGPLVCVYNRTGGARVLACRQCGEPARCARCGAAAARPRDEEVLRCPRCGETRPVVCAHCGRLRFKTLRAGVSRLREELAALLGVAVGEVAGPSTRRGERDEVPATRVLIGTEAVLHRVRRAAAVAFLDVDLHLLAPRLTATEDTLALMVRAGRLVGARRAGPPWARVLVQTRVPEHPVLAVLALGEPAPVLEAEVDLRRESGLPPFSALALVSGALGASYAAELAEALAAGQPAGGRPVTLSPLDEGRFLLQAPGHEPLCDLLAAVARPPGRGLRVEVDPPTV
jgi:primosomal protein N' (replication factor Y) (superfamily II helicase)